MAKNVPVSAGSKSYVLYKKETTFNTSVVPDSHFGISTDFSNDFRNNLRLNRGFKGSTSGGRDVINFTAGKAELDLSLEFDVNDDLFLEFVLGKKVGAVYSGDDVPPSMTIVNAIDNVTTKRNELYSGCVVDNCEIRGAEGEPITCSLRVKGSKLVTSSSLTPNKAIPNKQPYTFSESVFEFPSGTAIKNVINDFSLSIDNNWTMHYGMSRTAVAGTPGERAYKLSLNTKYVDDSFIEKALGGTSINDTEPTMNATFKIVLQNPSNDKLTFAFTLVPIDAYNLRATINEAISENIDLVPASLTITKS